MITAKTESGFSIELEESTLDNMEVLDALSDLDEGNPLAMSRLVVKLLGKDGKKRLYDHLRTEDGRVPASAVESTIMELFQSINAGKTLHPRRTDRNGRGRTDLRFCPVLQPAELACPTGTAGGHSGRRSAAGQPQHDGAAWAETDPCADPAGG